MQFDACAGAFDPLERPYFGIQCVFLVQILVQFQLSHHYALFYFETGSVAGFVALNLTLEFSAVHQKTSGPHNTTTTTLQDFPNLTS